MSDHLTWFCNEWLKCRSLNAAERDLIERLAKCESDMHFFIEARVLWTVFFDRMWSAVRKTRAERLCGSGQRMLKHLEYSVTFPTGRTLSNKIDFENGFGVITGPTRPGSPS